MDGGVVEGVTGNHLCLVVPPAVTESRGVVVHPGHIAAKLLHAADIAYVLQIGHAMVEIVEESGIERVVGGRCHKVVWRTDAVKSVHNHHGALGCTCLDAGTQRF